MPVKVSQTVELELRPCPRCGAFVALTADQWERRQKGSDTDSDKAAHGYYCPNGHVYGWWESEVDRQRKRADEAEAKNRALLAEQDGMLAKIAAQKKEAQRIAKRVHAGVCIHCHRTFQNMARHMETKHPAAQ